MKDKYEKEQFTFDPNWPREGKPDIVRVKSLQEVGITTVVRKLCSVHGNVCCDAERIKV